MGNPSLLGLSSHLDEVLIATMCVPENRKQNDNILMSYVTVSCTCLLITMQDRSKQEQCAEKHAVVVPLILVTDNK